MPARPYSVLSAILAPPGPEISTAASSPTPYCAATSAILARIIARGAGLIAGSPGGSGSPGRGTVPTPSPARKLTPAPGGCRRTVATISAACVTAGSSPASLTIPALAQSSLISWVASANSGRRPLGSATGTGSGNTPPTSASNAARAAPAAQAPVVQPRRKGGGSVPVIDRWGSVTTADCKGRRCRPSSFFTGRVPERLAAQHTKDESYLYIKYMIYRALGVAEK